MNRTANNSKSSHGSPARTRPGRAPAPRPPPRRAPASGQKLHRARTALRRIKEELEIKVSERTAALTKTNSLLELQIAERQWAEMVLRRREKELSDLIENAPIGLRWIGADGTILWANRMELDLFGYESNEYIGHHISEFHVDQKGVEDILRKLSRDGTLKDYVAQVRCKNGSLKHVLISSNVLWENGRFIHTRCFTRDITERRRAEEQIFLLNQGLEERVLERTAELRVANSHLAAEITQRIRAQALLAGQKRVLEMVAVHAPLPEVLRAIAEFVEDRVSGLLCSLWVLDPDGGRLLAGAAPSLPAPFLESLSGRGLEAVTGSGARPGARGGRVMVTAMATDPSWASHREIALEHGIGACWSQPIRSSGGDVLGFFAGYVGELRQPNQEESQLMEIASEIAGIAIERHRADLAFRESEERFRLLVDGAKDYAIFMLDPDGRVTTWNAGAQRIIGIESDQILGRDFARFHVPEDRLQNRPQRLLEEAARSGRVEEQGWCLREDGSHFWAETSVVALRDEKGHLDGFVSVIRDITERKRAEHQNQRLFDDIKEARDRLHELSRRLVEVQEEERRRIARELHDEIGQGLTALKMSLDLGSRLAPASIPPLLEDAQMEVNRLIGRVRELSLDLRPAMLDDLGLLHALLWHFQRYTSLTRIKVDFGHRGLHGRRLRPEVETAGYRMVQEALTNVARHAHADTVRVRLRADAQCLWLEIRDDGVGFDPGAVLVPGRSSGLSGMRERAALLGGELSMRAAQGEGVRITARLPLEDRDEDTDVKKP